MASNLLFVVHGMGSYPSGWENEIRTKLEEVAKRYTAFEADPTVLWQRLRLVPVGYDDLLRGTPQEPGLLERWKQDAGGLLAFAAANKLASAGSLDWLEPLATQDQEFFWERVADVVAYRFFGLVRDAIRVRVARRILDELVPAGTATDLAARSFERATVLAHSLGTAVTHDALSLLGTTRFEGHANVFSPPMCRFRAVFQLANVSRVLANDIPVDGSIVHGGPVGDTGSDCTRFASYRHKWDPFCLVRTFRLEADARFNTLRAVDHFRDWNVHGFTHYLDHPHVHVPLLNSALGQDFITGDEYASALAAYKRFGDKLEQVAGVQEDLRAIREEVARLEENSGLATLFEVAGNVFRKLASIRARVEQAKKDLGLDREEDPS